MAIPLRNDRLLRALARQPVDRRPIWLMRQAGRYLPEYRAVREKAGTFMDLCRNPAWACEVTLQPVERFDLDAAILFSDILTVPDAMGLGLHFVDGEGPAFARRLQAEADILRLSVPDPETELRYVMDAVRTIKQALDGRVPLIGFAGSPWTLACYMLEGRGSRDFASARRLRFEQPELLDRLLATLTAAVTRYLAAQAAAGADALMIFDTWGGLLDPDGFRRFSLAPTRRLSAELASAAPGVPLIAFSKGAGAHLEELSVAGCAALGIDWTTSPAAARAAVGGRVALQGNLDPVVLLASPEVIRERAFSVLDEFGDLPGHVFNLGHGILPGTPPEHVAALVRAVREHAGRDGN